VRRFYQENWLGTDFSSFARLAFFRLAAPAFYERFYEEIFRVHDSLDSLPENWRASKALHAVWLAGQAKETGRAPLRVLSFGCGLGWMEREFLRVLPDCELHVSEPGGACMRWIRAFIPPQRIHAGSGVNALPPELRFDLIYLSAADYFLRRDELTALLRDLRGRLDSGRGGGRLVLLSASLQEDDGPVSALVHWCRVSAYALLHLAGIRRRQFWGWLRTRGEYGECMRGAGFVDVREGRLDDRERTFWITGACT
jgi:hypothetical protein